MDMGIDDLFLNLSLYSKGSEILNEGKEDSTSNRVHQKYQMYAKEMRKRGESRT